MTAFDHDKALAYPIWPAVPAADVIFDSIITLIASEQRDCSVCGGQLKTGDVARVRFAAETITKLTLRRACALCCAAMANAGNDNGRALAARSLAEHLRRPMQ